MKTTKEELEKIKTYFPPMSDAKLESMVSRNHLTVDKLEAFKVSLERGKK